MLYCEKVWGGRRVGQGRKGFGETKQIVLLSLFCIPSFNHHKGFLLNKNALKIEICYANANKLSIIEKA